MKTKRVHLGGVERRWLRHIEGVRRSGLSVRAYCRRHGIREWEFYSWQARLKKAKAAQSRKQSGFVSIPVQEMPVVGKTFCIKLGNGVEMEFDREPSVEWVMAFLKSLG